MRCEPIQRSISARLDHEEMEVAVEAVEAHLATCGACRRFSAGAAALHRRQRLRPAEPVPDLVDRILAVAPVGGGRHAAQPGLASGAAVRTPASTAVPAWSRYGLLFVALVQLFVALPGLVWGEDVGASVHVARELGGWDVALAVAWLTVAWRPRRAGGLLPFTAPLALMLVSTAVLDLLHGRIPAVTESHHLLDLAGIACTWHLARHGDGHGEPLTPASLLHRPRHA